MLEEITDCQYIYINFFGSRCDELFQRFNIKSTNRHFTGFTRLISLWFDSISLCTKENIDLVSESILLYSISQLQHQTAISSNLINHIIDLSEKNFTDTNFSLASLAIELGYTSKYISHIFREKTGTCYSDYLRSLRVKYAMSLIDHGIVSVTTVAFSAGFKDPLYFSTVFKKSLGISPTEYRKNLQCKMMEELL